VRIIDPANTRRPVGIQDAPQNDASWRPIAVHMKANGVKTLGYMRFALCLRHGWLAEIKRARRPTAGNQGGREEKYNRRRRVSGHRPGAEAGRGDPDAVLSRRRGYRRRHAAEGNGRGNYKGKLYRRTAWRTLNFCGRGRMAMADAAADAGPMLAVRTAVPTRTPSKKVAAEYISQ